MTNFSTTKNINKRIINAVNAAYDTYQQWFEKESYSKV